MIKIGSICPLFFNPLKDKFSRDIDYIQRFYTSDKLLMQILCDDGEAPEVTLYDKVAKSSTRVALSTHLVNDFMTLYYFTLTGLNDSVYTVTVEGIGESELFAFCSSEFLLEETSLIRYSHKDNNSVDDIFWIGEEQQEFEIRYECGFKPSGISLEVEVEQFRNQNQEIIGLYAIPYKKMQLSCGDATGLPWWFGEHLNKILCLSKVEIGGVEYVRSGDSKADKTLIAEDSQMFFISVLLEPRLNEVHGIGGEVQVPSGSGSASIIINNPKDGDTFLYDKSQLAFVNKEAGELAALSEPINVTYPQTGFISAGKVLPKKMTHEDIFRTMLSDSALAVLTGNISTPNDVEFGTPKGALTYTAKRAGNGAITKAYYDNEETNKLEFSNEVSGIQTAIRQLTGIYTQKETYTATVIFAESEDKSIPEQILNNTISVNVRRKWFAGVCTTAPATSSDVRSLSSSGLYTGSGTYKFPVGPWSIMVICIPTGDITEVSRTKTPGNYLESPGVYKGTKQLSVEGANGSEAIPYTMYVFQVDTISDADTFTFKTN